MSLQSLLFALGRKEGDGSDSNRPQKKKKTIKTRRGRGGGGSGRGHPRGQRSSGGVKTARVHSLPLPTLLLLEELTDVLGGHDLWVADGSGHMTGSGAGRPSLGAGSVLTHLSLGGKALQEVLQLALQVIVS